MINNKKVVLITGVCGETGSYTAEECLRHNEIVIGIDNLFKGTIDNVKTCLDNPNFTLIVGDLRNINNERYLFERIYGNVDLVTSKDGLYIPYVDEVYNLGAIVETRYFYERPDLTYKVNCQGAIDMFDWAIKHNVKKFVNASSSEIYGHGGYIEGNNINWDEHTKSEYDSVEDSTRWSYAHGKILTEYYMNHFKNKIDVCHLRYANCYGDRDLNPEHIIPAIINALLTGTTVNINKDYNNFYRSYLYMSDAGRATYMAMKNMKTGTAYNIGTNDLISVGDLIVLIIDKFKLLGYTGEFKYNPVIDRPGDPKYRCLDCTRAFNELGWKPEVSLGNGIISTIIAMDNKLKGMIKSNE